MEKGEKCRLAFREGQLVRSHQTHPSKGDPSVQGAQLGWTVPHGVHVPARDAAPSPARMGFPSPSELAGYLHLWQKFRRMEVDALGRASREWHRASPLHAAHS